MSIDHIQIPPGQMGLIESCIQANPRLKGQTIAVRETIRALIAIGGPKAIAMQGQARTHRNKTPEQKAAIDRARKAQLEAQRAGREVRDSRPAPTPEPEPQSAAKRAKKKKTSKAKATKKTLKRQGEDAPAKKAAKKGGKKRAPRQA